MENGRCEKRGRDKGGRFGLATHPKRLPSTAIRKILERALSTQGIRDAPLPKGVTRYEFKGAHGFRKFFQTRAAQVMSFINVELLMGHSIGLANSYYKPVERDVLADYLKAVDSLTINDNNKLTLQKLVEKEEQIDKEAEQYKKRIEELEARQTEQEAKQRAMERGFRIMIKTGTMNPFIKEGATDYMRSLIEEQKEEIKEIGRYPDTHLRDSRKTTRSK